MIAWLWGVSERSERRRGAADPPARARSLKELES